PIATDEFPGPGAVDPTRAGSSGLSHGGGFQQGNGPAIGDQPADHRSSSRPHHGKAQRQEHRGFDPRGHERRPKALRASSRDSTAGISTIISTVTEITLDAVLLIR